MNQSDAQRLAERLLAGELNAAEFAAQIASAPTGDLGNVYLDLDRARRCGFPEVVFAQGKSEETLAQVIGALLAQGDEALATRVSPRQAEHVRSLFPNAAYNVLGKTLRVCPAVATQASGPAQGGKVAIVTAGASDLPVAEEARETLSWMGAEVTFVQDVGVAGPHRLPSRLPELAGADAIVVIAGMEGALPSVVGGYVDCPVIGVPTSVGYGANLAGVAALLSMLNTCASNVSVVNIDAGFKGAYVAGLIARNAARARRQGAAG